ncbi:MAG: LuxR C-terminal-related transcriptional regulator [Chloroflexota bacterium]|nr:LuxR C-terminal-related transcriptional regulator [Chloroflexota bacterium]
MIRVALIDDHPLILKILRHELGRETDMSILWDAADTGRMIALIKDRPPDVLVLDLNFAGQDFEPTNAVRDLRARHPRMAILILTANDDPVWVDELLRAGAAGYVVKSDDFSLRLAEAIRSVARGVTFLSPAAAGALASSRRQYTLTSRERSILRLVAQGISNPDIAKTLGLADGTIRNHLSNIYGKLEVDSRDAAVRAAQNLRELPRPNASIRHELRTPLHALLGIARLLENRLDKRGALDASDADLLHQIVLEAERLDGMIADMD